MYQPNRPQRHFVTLVVFGLAVLTFIIANGKIFAQDTIKIAYGQTVNGEIAGTGDQVNYAFQAHKGDTVSVTVVSQSGDFEPQFYVYQAAGALGDIGDSVLSAEDNSAKLSLTIPATAQYIIAVSALDDASTGQFALTLEGPG